MGRYPARQLALTSMVGAIRKCTDSWLRIRATTLRFSQWAEAVN